MPKRIAHLEETILREARRLFEEKGYDRVDVKEIAEAAGTAAGNLYNYYPSKQELFFQTVEQWHRELQEDLASLTRREESPREKLAAMMDSIYRHVRRREGVWREFIETRERGRQARCTRLHGVMRESEEESLRMVAQFLREIQEEAGEYPLGGFEDYWARSPITAAALLPLSSREADEANLRFLHHYLSVILPHSPASAPKEAAL